MDAQRLAGSRIDETELVAGQEARREPRQRQREQKEHNRVGKAVSDALEPVERAGGSAPRRGCQGQFQDNRHRAAGGSEGREDGTV